MISLKEAKFAELSHEQIDEIQQLEQKLAVTLIAYELFAIGSHTNQGNNSDVINPS